MKARKKPIEIDVFLNDNPINFFEDLAKWVMSFNDIVGTHFFIEEGIIKVRTLEGTSYNVTPEDVIIRGVKGEYYPCKRDVFELTYDLITE